MKCYSHSHYRYTLQFIYFIVKNNKGEKGTGGGRGTYLTSALFKWEATTLSTPPDTLDPSPLLYEDSKELAKNLKAKLDKLDAN